ncbi:MAG: hypothetical protein V1825_00600, partial [Candidatus Falkowbacteria bacterium]
MKMKKTILIIGGILLVIVAALAFVLLNKSEPLSSSLSKCGDGVCQEKERANPKLCREDCEPLNPEREACGLDNNGYCIDSRKECRKDYEGIGPDKCAKGRSAECCMPVKKGCKNENEFCGGIAGIECCSGLTCEYDGDYPDAGGVCAKESVFDFDDSPFGFHPGSANNYAYIQDM